MKNEKRLIDANALKSCLCKCCNILHSEEPCEPSECNVMEFIDSQPTVDAVEVVHGRWVMTLYTTTSKRGRVIANHKFACSVCGYDNGRKKATTAPTAVQRWMEGMRMFKKYDPAIIGYPYPTAGGYWRCFDGEKWHDCDRNGKVKD